jgi:hypothetical protein
MTEQNDFLRQITVLLERAGIAYMVSGSVGSSFHGHPRATNDTDIVIDPSGEQLTTFIESLGPDFYVSREAAMQAFEDRRLFNVIDIRSGGKADFIIRKNRPFSQQEFDRRTQASFSGMDLYILSPEDSILSKLEWNKGRSSEIQFNDALGVLIAQKDKLDFEYLKKWAKELGIENALNRLIEEAGQ